MGMSEWGWNPDTIQAAGMIGVVISLVISSYVAYTSKRSLDAVKKEQSLRMRPWVGVTGIKDMFDPSHREPWPAPFLGISYSNVGTLPARNLSLTISVSLEGEPWILERSLAPVLFFPNEPGGFQLSPNPPKDGV